MYESMSPAERTLRARTAAHVSWAKRTDRSAPGRSSVEARLLKFERQVDPDGLMAPAERRLRAESLLKAQMSDLARKSAKARRASARVAAEA